MKLLDEQPNNAPILMLGRPLRLRGHSPLRLRRLAWHIRQHPAQARLCHYFLIRPDGGSNIRRVEYSIHKVGVADEANA